MFWFYFGFYFKNLNFMVDKFNKIVYNVIENLKMEVEFMKSIVDPGISIQELKQWIPEAEAGKISLLLIEDLKQEIQIMEKLAEKYAGEVKRLKFCVYAIDLPDKEKFIYVIITPSQVGDAYVISISAPVDSPQEVIFQGKLSDLLRFSCW